MGENEKLDATKEKMKYLEMQYNVTRLEVSIMEQMDELELKKQKLEEQKAALAEYEAKQSK